MKNLKIYENLPSTISDIEFAVELLEVMIQNGHHKRANRYLTDAVIELKRALSDLSDAEFNVFISSDDEWEE